MKFVITGDWEGEIEAQSYNSAQVEVEKLIFADNHLKKFIRKWLGVKKSYNFEMRVKK